jgi:uncharacterized protein
MQKVAAWLVALSMVVVVVAAGCTEQKPSPSPLIDDQVRAVQVVQRLNNGTLGAVFSQWFTTTVQQQIAAAQLEQIWTSLQNQYGGFQNITKTKKTTQENYTNIFVTCLFSEQIVFDVEVSFDSQYLIAGFLFVPSDLSNQYRPPPYANPSNFTESNVTVGAGTAWPLPGTLTMPKGNGPFPAVVLVQGSGPNDRDETILANKPFKDLAWGLASQGITVLRYEKRTKQYGTQIANQLDTFTVWDETVQDTQRAIILLWSTPEVNASLVFVLGHSLGGMLAPRIAANMTGIAGLILLAAPARHIEDLALNQTLYLASLEDNLTPYWEGIINNMSQAVEKIHHAQTIAPGEFLIGAGKSYWVDLEAYNQVATARNLSLSMLLLQGRRDYQVNYTDDFLRWQEALGSRPNVSFKAYANLSHLFMPGSEKPTNKDYIELSNVDKAVIDDITSWIHHLGAHRPVNP